MPNPMTSAAGFAARRQALFECHDGPVLLSAGEPHSRNFPANQYPFRACSAFLYFVGRSIPGAALWLADGRSVLLTDPPDRSHALWHGPRPTFAALAVELGVDEVRPLSEAAALVGPRRAEVATLPTQDAGSAVWLWDVLGRRVPYGSGGDLSGVDASLADAMIALRLRQDEPALAQLRHAARLSAAAHVAGICATRPGGSEREVLAAMLAALVGEGLGEAYPSIVTVAGEVLHMVEHPNRTAAGDLLLADVGGETLEGWAADITRTWPVSGAFSPTQRAIYELVLEAQRAAIAVVGPGREYRQAHEAAKRAMVAGLCDLGILRGQVDGLLERGAAALFFPHGVGHLLGLDVHDMEELGDRVGYAPGRDRSTSFGDAYLRLDRPLEPGMLVTIEPGFYQVPAILGSAEHTAALGSDLVSSELERYGDVRGIRIEDDVLVTADGIEILTGGVPKEPDAIEALMRG